MIACQEVFRNCRNNIFPSSSNNGEGQTKRRLAGILKAKHGMNYPFNILKERGDKD
jgi:hypothetical protein